MLLVAVALVLTQLSVEASNCTLQFEAVNVAAKLDLTSGELIVERDGKPVQKVLMGRDLRTVAIYEQLDRGFKLRNTDGEETEFTIDLDAANLSLFTVARRVRHRSRMVVDCVQLGEANWFGGPMQLMQYWPVQKLRFEEYAYMIKAEDNCAIAERYWLNSLGSFIYVEDEAPLFIDQNYGQPGFLCLEVKKALPYDIHDTVYSFIYRIGVSSDARQAHMGAIRNILGKPSGHPAEAMVKYTTWSTWARLKTNVSDNVLYHLTEEIYRNGWRNSQIEIDDDWEKCYGSLEFDSVKFPRAKHTMSVLKLKGFPRVTLWVHPFINKDCEPIYSEAKQKGFLVANHSGQTESHWWNSEPDGSTHLDFTQPEVAEWFTQRLQAIRTELGIDGFKYDGGEPNWMPPDPVLNGSRSKHPWLIADGYLRTVAKFGNLVEVRSARRTQDLPVFVRMNGKFSEWGWHNGLATLIPTLLMMNMVGYPLVLPDTVGGNGYFGQLPSKEMFIRWLQATVFMPSIELSFVPWDYDAETVRISKRMTDLHEKYAAKIMERFKLVVSEGYPVNPPIWWVSPDDTEAQKVYDQFMLGDDIIAAPVVQNNVRARDVYLPDGEWVDGNIATVYIGPRWVRNYSAPLHVLPYFLRKGVKFY
ncbi:myogenesis-regulating glycosidase-like [Ochlerotatus camptorhynchus]|uniref:myogenesis-regulating glycosidase-like n=1 Tax=Ochlerotatus camptorhynchus TaxID=644619 RepID=UPI0031E08ABE